MLGPSLLAIGSFLLLTSAAANPIAPILHQAPAHLATSFSCGSHHRQPGDLELEKTRISDALKDRALRRRQDPNDHVDDFTTDDPYVKSLLSFSQTYETKIVPVTFHVVYANKTSEGGYVSSRSIDAQMTVLNEAFSSAGFSFVLKGLDYTQNLKWFEGVGAKGDDGSADKLELAMRKKLQTGAAKDLNVWTVGTVNSNQTAPAPDFGYAAFPWWYQDYPERDGIVMQHYTLPNTMDSSSYYAGEYSAGITLVHETGHWLGLHHTFSEPNGCDEKYGDQVHDTPTESSAAWPTAENPMIGRDTCPDSPGLDPISNYMDYAPDSMSTTFTIGQASRMIALSELFRGL